MRFCGFHAQSQSDRDFFCTFAFCQQLHNLTFARSQTVAPGTHHGAWSTAFQISFQDHCCDLGCEVDFIVTQSFDSCDQISRRIGLEQKTTGACIQNFTDHLVRIVQRKNQDTCMRIGLQYLPCGFEAVQRRHSDIENEHVRLELKRLLNGFAPVTRFAADLPFRLRLQQRDQSLSYYFMVVSNQNTENTHTYLPEKDENMDTAQQP